MTEKRPRQRIRTAKCVTRRCATNSSSLLLPIHSLLSCLSPTRQTAMALSMKAGYSRNGARKCRVSGTSSSVLRAHSRRDVGYARRYFTLHESGLLSYAFSPGGTMRDQVSLRLPCSIASSASGREIHIDAQSTFHIRALSQPDFDAWMTALR